MLTDANGDAWSDLLLYNASSGVGYLGIGDGTGALTFGSVSFGSGYDTISIQDLNGDGMQDVVIYNTSTGTSYAGLSTGTDYAYTYTLLGSSRIIAR